MGTVLENIRSMREKAKASETNFYTSKFGNNLSLKDLKDGDTILRIAPTLSEEYPSPFIPFKSVYLEIEADIDQLARYNLIKLIGERKLEKNFNVEKVEEIKEDPWSDDKIKLTLKDLLGKTFMMKINKRVFCANLHAKKEGLRDLVDEYIKAVIKKVGEECGDPDERKKLLRPINGWQGKDKWISGIKPSINFVCYCWDWSDSSKPFYKFEFYDKQMSRIEELYSKFDKGSEPITIDPFSHSEEGVGVQFTKKKNDKSGKFEYIVDEAFFDGRKNTWQKHIESFKLSKEQLDQLKEVKSLQELFGRGVFKASDFEMQLNGLILFDEKNGYNIFQNDDFLSIVEELSNQHKEERENEETASGKDIDKAFAVKREAPINIKAVKTEYSSSVDETEENEDSENESFREDEPKEEAPVKTNDKLAALKKSLNKKK